MKDSIGGVFNIMFVAVFITVISGYLAFSVSYNKAFKVKNKIISVLEQYQHYNSESQDKIDKYIAELGYNTTTDTSRVSNPNKDKCWKCQNGYCIAWTYTDEAGSSSGKPKGYYSVVTFVEVDIPVFNYFLPYLSFFQTTGDTMTIIDEEKANYNAQCDL